MEVRKAAGVSGSQALRIRCCHQQRRVKETARWTVQGSGVRTTCQTLASGQWLNMAKHDSIAPLIHQYSALILSNLCLRVLYNEK